MENKIKQNLLKLNLQNTKLLVGFSGGFDSLALLNSLINLKEELNLELYAAHINHNWRENSKKEEDFCKDFCSKNEVQFFSTTLSDNIPHTELDAREERYKFFKKIAKQENINHLVTAHNLNDNVETLIYRFSKGTGLKGLTCIPEQRIDKNLTISRPLLNIQRTEIEEYCKINNLTPNIDESNKNTKYKRNKIREEILPLLKEINPKINEAVSRLIEFAKENENYLQETLSEVKKEVFKDKNIINSKNFHKLSNTVQKLILKEVLEEKNIEFDMKKINEIISFINETKELKNGKTLSITTDLWLFSSQNKIKFIIKQENQEIFHEIKSEGIFQTEFFKVEIEKWQDEAPKKYPKENDDEIFVDLKNYNFPLFIRTRKEGDKITPFGMREECKLKKFLINKAIPKHERDNLLLLTTENEVLWVHSVGINDKIKSIDKPSHKIKIVRSENG